MTFANLPKAPVLSIICACSGKIGVKDRQFCGFLWHFGALFRAKLVHSAHFGALFLTPFGTQVRAIEALEEQ